MEASCTSSPNDESIKRRAVHAKNKSTNKSTPPSKPIPPRDWFEGISMGNFLMRIGRSKWSRAISRQWSAPYFGFIHYVDRVDIPTQTLSTLPWQATSGSEENANRSRTTSKAAKEADVSLTQITFRWIWWTIRTRRKPIAVPFTRKVDEEFVLFRRWIRKEEKNDCTTKEERLFFNKNIIDDQLD